ncbi:MAG TPA: DNA replication and repair protein RecF [Actinomycetota bacterium]
MRLAWIEVRDFRNHARTRLEVPAGLTAVVGANAHGKTNLLEAAHYLLTLSSPRTSADQPLIREGAGSAFLRGEVETAAGRVLVEVEIRPSGANRIQVNRSSVRRKRDLRSRVRSVFFIPEDLAIVAGGPEERRRFLDEAAYGLWPMREGERRAYDRTLRQRNRLLKEHEGPGAPAELEAWDVELISAGVLVTAARAAAAERVAPRASQRYEGLSGDRLLVAYAPSVAGKDLEAAFREGLAARRRDELIRRTTLVGPHRDDLELAVRGRTARRFASHGEAWAAALCFRLGLTGALEAEVGEPPVLLLDDPFSGIDPERRRRLAASLSGGPQTLLAVPDETQIPDGAVVWEVRDGAATPR